MLMPELEEGMGTKRIHVTLIGEEEREEISSTHGRNFWISGDLYESGEEGWRISWIVAQLSMQVVTPTKHLPIFGEKEHVVERDRELLDVLWGTRKSGHGNR
jgi:hypothetical protein